MGSKSDFPMKHVVSFRVTDAERAALEEMASCHGFNVSELLRESLYLLDIEMDGPKRHLFSGFIKAVALSGGKGKNSLAANRTALGDQLP